MYLNIYTEGHSQKHTVSTDTLQEYTHFYSCIFSTLRNDDLLLGLAVFGSLSLEGRKEGYKVQQLITKQEHFQQTINNHGLFNR